MGNSFDLIKSYSEEILKAQERIDKLSKENEELSNIIEQRKQLIEECYKVANENKEKIGTIKKTKNYKLDLIEISAISPKRLMNRQEFFIYNALLYCEKIRENFFVCPQVSTRAFIEDDEQKTVNGFYSEVYNIYNNFYVDFLLIDKKNAEPMAVLEFHGSGHSKNDSYIARDEIKEKLFKSMSLPYFILKIEKIYNEDNGLIDSSELKIFIEEMANSLCKNDKKG